MIKKGKTIRRLLLIVAAIFLIYVIAALISTAWNDTITASHYEIPTEKLTDTVRIVLLSDLHRKQFDETNQIIIDKVAEQEPDLICVDGDMLERDHTEEEDEAYRFLLERLMEIAPVYFSAGNHDYIAYCETPVFTGDEYAGMTGRSETLDLLESTGAVFLESDYEDSEINGQKIRIGGFYPFAFRYEYDSDENWNARRAFLEDYCDTDCFKLMLSHRPDSFIFGGAGKTWDVDLVLSGHTHNGLIALPFGLGAIWTSEGFFPEHDMGEFDLGSMKMIITSGFAGWRFVPRVFNPPEFAVIDLIPE